MTIATTIAWTRSTAVVENAEFSFMRGGSGAPLLFLHGTEAFTTWLPFMDELASRYDVIVPDHPGFGRSATPSWLDGIGDLVHFYRSFMTALNLRDVVLAGHDIGGWIACELVLRDASRVRSLVLVAAAGLPLGVDGIDTFMCSPSELRRASYVDEGRAPALDDETIAQQAKNALMTARMAWQPRFYDSQLVKWLHTVHLPALIVWGTGDVIFPAAQAATFAALLAGARTVLIPDAGHVPHVEQPHAFVRAITEFAPGEQP